MAYLFVFILNALHKYFRSRSQACLFCGDKKCINYFDASRDCNDNECIPCIRMLPADTKFTISKSRSRAKILQSFLSVSSADTTLVWAKSQMIIDGCLYNLCIQNRSKLYIFHRFIYLGHHVPPLKHLATKTRMLLIALRVLKNSRTRKYPLDWPL